MTSTTAIGLEATRHEFKRCAWLSASVTVMTAICIFAIADNLPPLVWWCVAAPPIVGLVVLRRQWRAVLDRLGIAPPSDPRPAPSTVEVAAQVDAHTFIDAEFAVWAIQAHLAFVLTTTTVVAMHGLATPTPAVVLDLGVLVVIGITFVKHGRDAASVARSVCVHGRSEHEPMHARLA